jgi:uncharacterized cupredoxin-like copper-binding protein
VADIALNIQDYRYATTPVVTSGTHTFRVTNMGKQSHEAVLVRLAPGKTAADFLQWARTASGPPPATLVGGETAMDSGQHGYFTATFTPGHYALMCFVSDDGDNIPHFAKGMVKEFTVQ